jgi:hypothetical protein
MFLDWPTVIDRHNAQAALIISHIVPDPVGWSTEHLVQIAARAETLEERNVAALERIAAALESMCAAWGMTRNE